MNHRLRAVARTAVSTVNHPIAKRRIVGALADAARPLRLEIGGRTPREGWVVTNISATTRNYLDATKPWPLEEGAVEYVYADNVIEHVPLEAGRAILSQAARAMRPGGVIRLVTPDIRAHVTAYLSGASPTAHPAGRHYQGMGLTVEHPVDLLRIPIGEFGHHTGYIYDFETLAAELVRAGFSDPVRCEPGQSSHAPLVGLELRNNSGDGQMAVEATR